MIRTIFFFSLALLVILSDGADARSIRLGPSDVEGGSSIGGLRFPSSWEDSRRSVSFVLEKGQRKILTGITFIVPESDSVSLGDTLLSRERDYRLNYLRGTLILAKPADGGERLRLSYVRYPFRFAPLFAARLPKDSIVTYSRMSPFKREKKDPSPRKSMYSLNLSGSKSVGVSFGTGKGMGLDQSLQISMAGMITRDIKVSAYLTDDNLPVQPEGNTEEIRQLDRVYVKLESRDAGVTFGDLSTGVSWAEFSSFKWELRGISGGLSGGDWRVFAGGGINKGRFRTVRISGREGVQGPYELLPARRFNGVIILPGSESVYLDGKLLKRGRENDYIINYALGTVTFTERVTISSDSEIVVDFQISEDNYRRTTVFAGWTSPDYFGSFKLRTYFIQEGDDAAKPLGGELTDEERAIIESAGDDWSKAISDGIRKVDKGLGNYILVEQDTIPSHFEFVEDGGEYVLSFIEVGSGEGDYVTDGFSTRGQVKYRYVGPSMGDFIIGRKLPLPERKRLSVVQISAKRGVFAFRAEGDVSSCDGNILSTLDDDDNTGTAYSASLGIDSLALGGFHLAARGNYSFLDARFRPPERERKQYYYRSWGLENVPRTVDESSGGAGLSIGYRDLMKLSMGWNELARESGLSATKRDLEFSLGEIKRRGLRIAAYRSSASNNIERRFFRGEGAFSFWKLLSAYSYEEERYSSFYPALPDTGRFYTEHAMKISTVETGRFRASILLKRRNTSLIRESNGSWYRARRNDDVGLRSSYSAGGMLLDLLLTHRMIEELEFGDKSWYDLARVRFRNRWEKLGITTDVNYRISSGEERTRDRAVIYVGENQGDYDSEGREVGQKRGDYMLLYLPGRGSEKIHSVLLDLKLSFGAGVRGMGTSRGTLAGKLARYVSCDNFLTVEERSRSDDLLALYLLNPSTLQRNDLTVYGITRLRQEWHFLNNLERFNLSLILSREDEEDNRSEADPVDRYARDVRFRIYFATKGRLSFQWEIGEKRKKREAPLRSEQVYDVKELSTAQKLNYRVSGSTRFSFELAYEWRKDAFSMTEQRSLSGTPSLNSSVGKRVNIMASFRMTYTSSREKEGKPLFFLENGLREEWTLTSHYRFTGNLSLGLNYFGRRERDYTGEVKTVHDLKVESRAYF